MEERYGQIPLTKIDRDPLFQVRQHWDPDRDPTLPALVQSLQDPEGQIHPIVVVARTTATTFGRLFTLIAGHRRLAAAERAGWATILARILPPCDLTALEVRLRLLAMAIQENIHREPLVVEDRRAALGRLQALYQAVHPERAAAAGAEPTSFARWAAGATQIPERTIRRDLRCLLVAPGLYLPAPAANQPVPCPPDPEQDALAYVLHLGQQATAALRHLTAHLTPKERARLTPDHVGQLAHTLHELHATLEMALTAATMPSPRSLDAFTLLLQQRVPPLTGALQGLATSPQAEWEAAPPLVPATIQTAMGRLLTAWEQVQPTVLAHTPTPRRTVPAVPHRLRSRPPEVST
jgi:ParB-like chromosome segregation protein Spo0J